MYNSEVFMRNKYATLLRTDTQCIFILSCFLRTFRFNVIIKLGAGPNLGAGNLEVQNWCIAKWR